MNAPGPASAQTPPRARAGSPFLSVRLQGQRSAMAEQCYGRLMIVCALFGVGFLLVGLRVLDLSIIQPALNPKQAVTGQAVPDRIEPAIKRGMLTDRNGEMLSASLETASLFADPKLILDIDETIGGLARIFPDLNAKKLKADLTASKRFVWIKRSITPAQQEKILELGQPGLGFQPEYRRLYPQSDLTAHTVGYTTIDGKGLSGLELGFEPDLSAGRSVHASIDIRLQHIVKREVHKAMQDFNAIGGLGMVMDVKTGEILASVSLPDYDPHKPAGAPDTAKFNRFSLGVYEPGSTFKIFSTAALLDTQKPKLGRQYDTRAPIRVGRFTISDYHPENRPLTIPEIFIHSSNIGTAYMARDLGTVGLRNFYKRLGLLDPVSCEIKDVGAPIVPSPWRDISTLTASYGHGIAVSPLQLIAATAATVNGGYKVRPTFQRIEPDKPGKDEVAEQVMDADTSATMRKLLRLVVTDGTGGKADVPGYEVGGKTGTAEKIIGRGYDKKRLISSFIAAFPMSAPRYAVLVMIDEPKGTKASYGYATGGWVAAPAAGRIIRSMTHVLAIPPLDDTHADIAESLHVYLPAREEKTAVAAVATPLSTPASLSQPALQPERSHSLEALAPAAGSASQR